MGKLFGVAFLAVFLSVNASAETLETVTVPRDAYYSTMHSLLVKYCCKEVPVSYCFRLENITDRGVEFDKYFSCNGVELNCRRAGKFIIHVDADGDKIFIRVGD